MVNEGGIKRIALAFLMLIVLIIIITQFYGAASSEVAAGFSNSSDYKDRSIFEDSENQTQLALTGLLSPTGVGALVVGAGVFVVIFLVAIKFMQKRGED